MKSFLPFIAGVLFLVSCKQTVDTKAEGEKIMKLSRDWSKLAATKNVDSVVSYWADDAVLYSEGEGTLKGRAAIREMVAESFKIPGFSISWEPVSVTVSESGDMAYLLETSKISLTDSAGNPIEEHFNTVTIWRKQADGSWKTAVDVMTPAKK